MANLKEKPEWSPGVYQLETSDPVMGGPDGIDNLQAKQLANRTLYLKEQQEINASTTNRGRVSLSSSTNSKSETEAATPLAVKTTYDLATGANNAANTALSIANTAKSDASTALNIANTAKSDANIAKNTANTANDRANTAYNTAINAFPKTGGIVSGLIKSNQPKTYDIMASNSWIQAAANTFPNAILAHEAGGGGFAIVSGADDANLGNTANLTFASWNGVGFAPMQTGDKEDKAINSTVVVNCRLGTVYAMGDFYAQGKKLIKQDEYGVGHQNLSLTKISDNLNEQNASFFGSTYVNMPESIKPYINNGAGIVGLTLPYRATSEGWKFSSRFFTEVGGTPSKIFHQECHNGTWQKPAQLITDQNIKDHIGKAYIIETYKSEDGSSWYRKWSDGFIEQGIVKTGTFNMSTVHNLIKPFSNANYTIILNARYTSYSVSIGPIEKTTTTFTSEASRGVGGNHTYTTLTIYACGY